MRNVEEIRRKNLEDNKAFLEGLLMIQVNKYFLRLNNIRLLSYRLDS
jgi:hypothetical protein